MRALKIFGAGLTSLVLLVSCRHLEVSVVTFINHNLEIDVNVEKHQAMFSDTGVIHVQSGVNLLYLAPNADVELFSLDGKETQYTLTGLNDLASKNSELASAIKALGPPNDALWLIFESKQTKSAEFSIRYAAVFLADVSDVKFSNQNVGREVTGTILEQGAYFSPSSFYYPQGGDGLMDFKVTANIPAEWESISDGNSLSSETLDGRKIQTWQNPYQADGLMFMAAPFVVGHTKAGDVDVYCYFFEEDTSLFETYLPATAQYVEMYTEIIGAYPYERFTVAENFFPTGYGMPAWTLLGQQVIRLPFIVMTSLGHEVLHNWWGNSIYVDYENGNWCEGLTVYGADYLYKDKRSPASSKDYRKDILKQYKSYVNESNEFPVREFKARHNAESRTIGYNKTMMIFHMIDNMIGSENFFNAWQAVYTKHKGEKVTWEQWLAAYEKASGEDLSFIIPEWVDRKGAARLSVDLVETSVAEDMRKIKLKIIQPANERYTLKVPIRFYGAEDSDIVVNINEPETIIEVAVEKDVTSFEVDPDYNIFRHLYPQEIEPIVAAAMGAPEKHFLYMDAADRDVMKAFGDNLTEGDVDPVVKGQVITLGPAESYAFFCLNTDIIPGSMADLLQVNEETIIVNGQEFPRQGHTFVLSGTDEEVAGQFLKVISDDHESLPRIGQLIPHYGKYSYLVFKGAKNIAKGQWPAEDSPLKITL
ncbi:MAG: hypothetical protein K9M49_01400 [Candidatus Marinimicrobia bacterium]|nr:hypothetical protein [Candidatus Neomarinimicrobiota bacterium]MCF7903783.1 hypothetical protein [Candidatus Neomarinimicrobiota bacterium]